MVDRDVFVTGLRRLAAGEQIMIRGPVAIDRGRARAGHRISIETEGEARLLSWHGGHHHVHPIDGPLTLVGDALHVPIAERGLLVLRPIGPEDTWPVVPRNLTAWEAVQRRLG